MLARPGRRITEHGFDYYHGHDFPLSDFPALTHVNEAACTASHVLQPHAHPHYEICYFYAGKALWQTGSERFSLGPGDFYISRPGEVHFGRPDPREPNHNFAVGFDPLQLPLPGVTASLPLALPSSADLGRAFADTCAVAAVEPPSFRRVIPGGAGAETIYRRLLAELDALQAHDLAARALTQVMVQALLVELLVQVTRCSIAHLDGSLVVDRPRSPRHTIARLLEWLPLQLADPPSLSAMAARVGLSPTHFAVAFKREVGKTPLEYITDLRMAAAGEYLHAGRTVTDTALEFGFNSSQYFSVVFKKHFGCTPTEWRRSP